MFSPFLELCILSGINYVVKNPKDVDTYVKWEFPFPKETPVVDKTHVVKVRIVLSTCKNKNTCNKILVYI
jgi:hypothetical protein